MKFGQFFESLSGLLSLVRWHQAIRIGVQTFLFNSAVALIL
ncbi:MAG: hypothetical protein NT159_14995 [Proteobacteria bacterium]|nr:hypothetical protein [Pseudomonadota bacterium]